MAYNEERDGEEIKPKPSVNRRLHVYGVGLMALTLAGCGSLPSGPPEETSPQEFSVLTKDLSERTDPLESDQVLRDRDTTSTDAEPPRLQFSTVRQARLPSQDRAARSYLVESLELRFAEAPIADVVRLVINDALGETVAIANGVTGTVSLSSNGSVPTAEALESLDRVLIASGYSLVDTSAGFLLVPVGEAARQTAQMGQDIGFTREVVRIQNTIPSNAVRLAETFVPANVTVTPADEDALVFVEGPRAEVEDYIQLLKGFDLPALNDRIFGIYELRHAEVTALIAEIQPVLAAASGRSANLTTLIPLPRLNKLFVMTQTRRQFAEVNTWIERFDQPATGDERRLYYYTVKNTPADRLAFQLEAAFGQVSGSFRPPVPPPQTSGGEGQTASPPAFARRQGAATGLSIVADELNNALIIRATGSEYRDILALVERMDVLPPQVLIEATIAEVTLTDDLKFGIRWFFEEGKTDSSFPGGSGPTLPPVEGRFSISYIDAPNAGVAIDALTSVTDVEVISAPSIMVQNNQTANLQVGDQVPVVTQTIQSVDGGDAPIRSTVQLLDTGIILTVKPRINASDMVVLEIEQEVSDAVPTVTAGVDTPTIQQRQFSSTIAIQDNRTAILGGLIREAITDTSAGVPGLRQLPVMGRLFKSVDNNRRRTELIVFLTPKIIRNQSQSDAVVQDFQRRLSTLKGVGSLSDE